MISLLTSAQTRQADAYTIAHEPINSVDLMERASLAFVNCFIGYFPDKGKKIAVYCGTGNNGGDGLAVARLLKQRDFGNVNVKIARFSGKSSDDFDVNFARLKEAGIGYLEIIPGQDLPAEDADIIIDALLGTGLNKPITGDYAKLVKHVNSLNCVIVAVDVPTGLLTEGDIDPASIVMKADLVITFQQPKINYLLPDSAAFMDRFEWVDIGLDHNFINSLNSPYQVITLEYIRAKLKIRKPFDHKGTYGHALIIAGQPETMGAALLSASACAFAGAGLTTACVPQSGLMALNASHPEVMAIGRQPAVNPNIEWAKYTALAIGPGLGTQNDALLLLTNTFKNFDGTTVIDADALNLLAGNSGLFRSFPKGSIITPHMKEFDRLFGEHKSWWQRLQSLRLKAMQHSIYIVLKNRFTMTATPEGKIYFNPTGNPAMASGGMGDVLTGTIVSLLAQKYTAEEACLIGTYIHGKAGDELALPNLLTTVLAGQLAARLPATLAKIKA